MEIRRGVVPESNLHLSFLYIGLYGSCHLKDYSTNGNQNIRTSKEIDQKEQIPTTRRECIILGLAFMALGIIGITGSGVNI